MHGQLEKWWYGLECQVMTNLWGPIKYLSNLFDKQSSSHTQLSAIWNKHSIKMKGWKNCYVVNMSIAAFAIPFLVTSCSWSQFELVLKMPIEYSSWSAHQDCNTLVSLCPFIQSGWFIRADILWFINKKSNWPALSGKSSSYICR